MCRDSSNAEPVTYQELRAILKALPRAFMCKPSDLIWFMFLGSEEANARYKVFSMYLAYCTLILSDLGLT